MNDVSCEITLVGTVVENPVFSHEVLGEGFYEMKVMSKRTSDNCDTLVVQVSERIFDVAGNYEGLRVSIGGQIHSYNRKSTDNDKTKNKLQLYVFAKTIELLEDDDPTEDCDEAILEGFVCKEPLYRETPLGREISDFCLAINRPYGKSSYIPCIAWGRNARYLKTIPVGTHMHLEGRFQSRVHLKMIDGEAVERTVYEFSASRIGLITEEDVEEE